MKTWTKILVVAVTGAVVWGLSYCAGIWPIYSIVFASISGGTAALCGIVTGFTGPKA